MKCKYLLVVCLCLSCTANAGVFDGWNEIDSETDSASPVAEKLAKQMSNQLKMEKSKVVFLNIQSCSGASEAWCSSFSSSLETFFIKNGIKFLPESSRNEIREKIASEQVYQQSSMQVDIKKAVALGQQEAFQAFVTVNINGDSENLKITANSLNIKEGVISISETNNLKIKQKSYAARSVATWVNSFLLMGTGIGGTYYCLASANKEKAKADDHYDKYKSTQNPDEAASERKKVQAHDTSASYYKTGAIITGLLGLYGVYYFYSSGETTRSYSYKIGLKNFSFDSALASNGLGFSFNVDW